MLRATPEHQGTRRCCAEHGVVRSEEHTSELQSLTNLVCRLLLEKKKNKIKKESRSKKTKCTLQRLTKCVRIILLNNKTSTVRSYSIARYHYTRGEILVVYVVLCL